MLRNLAQRRMFNNNGFSLMEIIIAMGVLMVLSSVGVIAVKGIDDRAKEAKAQSAAKQLYSAARAKIEDNNPGTTPQQVIDDFNNSQTERTRNNNRPMTAKLKKNGPNANDIRVEVFYDGGRINAFYETPGSDGVSGGIIGEDGNPVTIPTIKDTVSQLTYQCNKETSGHLPVYNVSDDTTVSMVGSDGSEKLVDYDTADLTKVKSNWGSSVFSDIGSSGFNNVSERLTMKAGVQYTVKVYGTFENLSAVNEFAAGTGTGTNISFNDCLISIDRLGKDSGVLGINWIGYTKFVSVPKELPKSVTSLAFAFRTASNFNDENVSNWDISNVTSLYYTFSNASSFNQPLPWDTSNVTSIAATFVNASSFNQPLEWDTSKVRYMSSIFVNATSFNQDIGEKTIGGRTYWDTSGVNSMQRVFDGATSFNNGGQAGSVSVPPLIWRTENVVTMVGMFRNATSFNSLIYRQSVYWDVSKVSNFSEMFKNATSFSRGIRNWVTTSATNMSFMFEGSGFNQPLEIWDTSKVTNMNSMFKGASIFNRDLSRWNVANVTNRTDFSTGTAMENNTGFQPNWVK